MLDNSTTAAESYVSNPIEATKIAVNRFISTNLKSFVAVLLLAMLLLAIPMALLLATGFANLQGGSSAIFGWSVFASVVLFIVVGLIVNVATDYLYATSQNMQAISAKAALSRGWQRAGVLFLAGILSSLLVLVGLILFIIPGIYIALRLAYMSAIVANEDLGPIASIKRSWALTKGNLWDILGVAFTVTAAVMLINIALYGLLHVTAGVENATNYAWVIDLIVTLIGIPLAAVLYFRYHQSDLSKAGILHKEGTDSMNYLMLIPAAIALVAFGAYSTYINPPTSDPLLQEVEKEMTETNSI